MTNSAPKAIKKQLQKLGFRGLYRRSTGAKLLGVALGLTLSAGTSFGQPDTDPSPKPGSQDRNSVERPTRVLHLGEQRLISLPGLKRYSLSGKAVSLLPRPGDGLLLKAVARGAADLWVEREAGLSEHYPIWVEAQPTALGLLKTGLKQELGRLTQVEVVDVGTQVVLRGQLSNLQEAIRVKALAQNPESPFKDDTEYAPELLAQIESAAKNDLQTRYKAQMDDAHLGVEFGRVVLRGSLREASQRTALERELRARHPLLTSELESPIDDQPTVRFRVYLLELKQTGFQSLGLSWPSGQDAAFGVSPTRIDSRVALDLRLQALEGDGHLRVLSKPELVLRAPGEAELFSGGELPVQVSSRFFANVNWRPYGLTLKLKALHATRKTVRVDIQAEVSHIDSSIGSDEVPGFQANRMKTQVDARMGRPLLLSGLLQQSHRKSARGLPFLRQIPVLGLLFGSEDYLNDRSELVAVLMPDRDIPVPSQARFERTLPRGPLPIRSREVRSQSLDETDPATAADDPNYPWSSLE